MQETTEPRHPDVTVHLSTGVDGNIFEVMGAVSRALRAGGVPQSEIGLFTAAMFDADGYDTALRTCMSWVTVT